MLQEYLDEWIKAAGIGRDNQTRLFRIMHKSDQLTDNPVRRFNVLHMIKRQAQAAPTLSYSACCHLSRDGYHDLSGKRRDFGTRADHRPSRVAAHNEAL
jgi:hypothetical protein